MKYIIAVKFTENREVEIHEFDTEEERLIYAESLRYVDNVQDVSYTQIEREDDES